MDLFLIGEGHYLTFVLGNAVAIFTLLAILHRTIYGINLPFSFHAFKLLIADLVCYFIFDCLWVYATLSPAEEGETVTFILATLNVITISLAAYFWCCFIKDMVDATRADDSKRKYPRGPIVCVCIAYTLFYGTGFDLSRISEPTPLNALYSLLFLVPIGYCLRASYLCLRHAFTHYEEHTLYLAYAVFPLMPVVASLFELVFWMLPFMCYTFMGAIVFIYLFFLESLISKDTLTELGNRNKLMSRLASQLEAPPADRLVFLLMMDVDRFKTINDTYGHVEGDRALRVIAESLRSVERQWKPGYPFFPARYGGDEFIVLGECETRAEADGAKTFLRLMLSEIVEDLHLPYQLEVSIGLAVFDRGKPCALQAFIEQADAALYEDKRKRRAARESVEVARREAK